MGRIKLFTQIMKQIVPGKDHNCGCETGPWYWYLLACIYLAFPMMNSEFAQNLSTSERCQYMNQAYYSAVKNRYTPKCIMQKRKINVGPSVLLGHSSVVCTDF